MILLSIAAASALLALNAVPTHKAPADAAPPRASSGSSPPARDAREIILTDRQAKGLHYIRTAPSYPATVLFPEPFVGAPTCADCDEKGLFRIETFMEQRLFTIKPRHWAGKQKDGSVIAPEDYVTIVAVRLQHYTLVIRVEYTEKQARADPRVAFVLPDRTGETAYIQAERKRLEQEIATKVEKGVGATLLHSLMEPHSCSPLRDRARGDDLVLEATEICSFGARYFVRFFIENRSRDSLDLRPIELRAGTEAKTLAEAADADQLLTPEHLEFKARANGIIAYQIEEGQAVPRVFQIVALEHNGSGRTVSLTVKL